MTQPFDPLTALHAAAYNVYCLSLNGTDEGLCAFNWLKNPQPGDLVVETSSIYHAQGGGRFPPNPGVLRKAIGVLKSKAVEPWHTDEEWEKVKGDYDRRPVETVWYAENIDGSVCRWTNADFVRVASTVKPWRPL